MNKGLILICILNIVHVVQSKDSKIIFFSLKGIPNVNNLESVMTEIKIGSPAQSLRVIFCLFDWCPSEIFLPTPKCLNCGESIFRTNESETYKKESEFVGSNIGSGFKGMDIMKVRRGSGEEREENISFVGMESRGKYEGDIGGVLGLGFGEESWILRLYKSGEIKSAYVRYNYLWNSEEGMAWMGEELEEDCIYWEGEYKMEIFMGGHKVYNEHNNVTFDIFNPYISIDPLYIPNILSNLPSKCTQGGELFVPEACYFSLFPSMDLIINDLKVTIPPHFYMAFHTDRYLPYFTSSPIYTRPTLGFPYFHSDPNIFLIYDYSRSRKGIYIPPNYIPNYKIHLWQFTHSNSLYYIIFWIMAILVILFMAYLLIKFAQARKGVNTNLLLHEREQEMITTNHNQI